MKRLLAAISITVGLLSCQSAISPKKLVGEWSPTYQTQHKEAGKWGPWITINTLVALPNMEFKSNGDFLRDGKPGAGCCSAGNKYSVSGNTIVFSDFKDCPNIRCMDNSKWIINQLNSGSLVIEVGDSRSKFARVK